MLNEKEKIAFLNSLTRDESYLDLWDKLSEETKQALVRILTNMFLDFAEKTAVAVKGDGELARDAVRNEIALNMLEYFTHKEKINLSKTDINA